MSESTSPRPSLLSDGVYNTLKVVAQLFLPAAGTLYFALAQLWHLPHPAEVVGTITAVDAFLGALLGLSSISYEASGVKYLGEVDTSMDPTTGRPKLVFSVDGEKLDALPERAKDVTFKVNNSN